MENGPFEDVFPIKTAYISDIMLHVARMLWSLLLFRRVQYDHIQHDP